MCVTPESGKRAVSCCRCKNIGCQTFDLTKYSDLSKLYQDCYDFCNTKGCMGMLGDYPVPGKKCMTPTPCPPSP